MSVSLLHTFLELFAIRVALACYLSNFLHHFQNEHIRTSWIIVCGPLPDTEIIYSLCSFLVLSGWYRITLVILAMALHMNVVFSSHSQYDSCLVFFQDHLLPDRVLFCICLNVFSCYKEELKWLWLLVAVCLKPV